MKIIERTVVEKIFTSDVHPEMSTQSPRLGDAMAWADANPQVWKIVMGTKSKPFGKNSISYMASIHGDSPGSVIERVAAFKRTVDESESSIFTWRARFTLKHFGEKGFTGGLFMQFDGVYDRHSMWLDYTPETLEEVIDRFVEWCGSTHVTRHVSIDGKIVRRYVPESPYVSTMSIVKEKP